jgi:hypothetical protein
VEVELVEPEMDILMAAKFGRSALFSRILLSSEETVFSNFIPSIFRVPFSMALFQLKSTK